MPPQINPHPCHVDRCRELLDEVVLLPDHREHGAVVVGIGVDVEQTRPPGERRTDRVDRRPVAPFREVRHRLERQHAPYSRAVQEYYDRRAPEYDEWYLGAGLFAERERPGWEDELERLAQTLADLPAERTLDVACGTGFLTRHLRGDVVGLDQSESMLEEARRQAPQAHYIQGDALSLPFPDGSFDRIFTAHFYGHLEPPERRGFLAEARRVAGELVVVDSARASAEQDEARQERILNDGSRWEVYKRWFTPLGLASELGGGATVFDGRWFVAVRST